VRRPVSTYRIQLSPTFGFRHAAVVVPYLHDLGVTDLYISPPFAAMPGSTHGYDVVDHNTLRDELGGEAGFAALCDALRQHELGLLIDFVPNHMGIGPQNPWWMDVLENGPSSQFAAFFDVDWKPVKDELENKVLVPVLGDQFGAVLERGELKLLREGGAFLLAYWEHRFPIAPRAVPLILKRGLEALQAEPNVNSVNISELLSIITALEKLAPRSEIDAEKVAERAREKEVAKRRLAALFDSDERMRRFVDDNVAAVNGRPGDPHSFDELEVLLDHQAYRLAHWRVAGEEINYRRFFDINGLAAIRMEDERVFEETHRLVLRLIDEGCVSGLRIDHPDGLYTPSAYFHRLREKRPGLFVVVEKILEGREKMPRPWTVDGTTGYEFLVATNGLFVEPSAAESLEAIAARFTGEKIDWSQLIYRMKRDLMRASMASEINMLSRRLNRLSESNRRTRDFTLNTLSAALVEYVARLPIYRTYVEGTRADELEERDRKVIEATLKAARRSSRALDPTLFDFLGDLLLLRNPTAESIEFVRKLQQLTGPITAKAIEDTAFYRYLTLVSLNEVGGDPKKVGTSVEEFHALASERRRDWPGSLNATATHDTKRGEDTRLRIDALSEMPDAWAAELAAWRDVNSVNKALLDGTPAPSAADELLLYQSVIGALPDDGRVDAPFVARIQAYMEKALREAKRHTSWTNPDADYETAMREFVARVLGSNAFLERLVPFHRRVAQAARISSLAQVALKCCAPGVADVYQGGELWDTSLVDPDNRRPVDYRLRAQRLVELKQRMSGGPEARARVLAELSSPAALADGRGKLLLTTELLQLRRADPALFLEGDYLPLAIEGRHARHAIAFARRLDRRVLICVAPRLVAQLGEAPRWAGRVRLGELAGPLEDALAARPVAAEGDALDLSRLFSLFPVAILRRAR
jgi:(1->4)-alpha-D-glucan 1-alpha-D-glucosylmutase